MDAERWERIAELYHAAQECVPSERTAFLSQACQDDEELRREVESLLAQDVSQDGALERAAQAAVTWDIDRSIPATIGHYRIVALVGQGGMGAVYEAEQDHPRRTVALKVIKPGLVVPEVLRRFEQESEALGRLQHPGIAQIYEAGSDETGFGPQPYVVMEFIRGLPLVEYAKSHNLSTRQRVEIMIKVCEAVDHAHQRGIIHRDLKPGNILVDETGQPKILDFGVARITDSDARVTRQTDVGELIGTLAYMSPEQVLAEPALLDTRSDVYTLGVVLYELLADRLPYDVNRNTLETVRTIREDDPAPLSRISRTYRGDLETIVNKALRKDKERRYGSAEQLADDLRRYVDNRPIQARPPSATYRVRKFVSRHRVLVSATLLVFMALVAGIINANRERDRAVAAEHSAKAISDFLQNDLLSQASAAGQASPSTKPDPDLKVRTALDRAAARIGGKFDSEPLVEAAIRLTIGRSYFELGLYPQAQEQQERALELRRRALGPENADTLATMRELAGVYFIEGKYAQAEETLKKVMETQIRLRRQDTPEAVNVMNDLAEVASAGRGDHKLAESLLLDVIERDRRIQGPEHLETLVAMNNLALEYSNLDKDAQAEQLYEQTLAIMRRVLGNEHPQTLLTMNNLGATHRFLGHYAQAEALLSEVLDVRRRLLGPEHRDTLTTMNNLALVYAVQGKYAQAEPMLLSALDGRRRLLGEEHPETLSTMDSMAYFYRLQHKWREAETWLRKTVEARRRVLGPKHALTRIAMINLGLVEIEQGRFTEAEQVLREAQKGVDTSGGGNWRRYYGQSMLGAALAGMHRYPEAEPLLLNGYKHLADRQNTIPADDRPVLEQTRQWIAQLYQAWGKPDQASRWR
ncbi:MAG TPA: serine/threonine-protein kinase [Bryobacteraceae bacterium]|nr:serine/threonine-protein kinase [Bryobacteraceae bacterium]